VCGSNPRGTSGSRSPSGASTTGYGMPSRDAIAATSVAVPSSALIPTTSTPSGPKRSRTRASAGISRTHGPHHDAHRLTTTIRPR